ncbi:hypothetical protein [Polluticoccus soli]|uniref:hypothetical protein n=1 Tax=Polluticoccus soli TaxID=3034150 RepID=UPI0023E29C6D|nr:hypothetical protein [Flavipsychrobacter sp. JY13-12]
MKQFITTLAIAGVTLVGVTSCNTSAVKEKNAALEAQQKTIDSMKVEMAKKQVIDSMSEVARTQFVVPQVIPSAQVQQSVAPRKHTVAKKRSTRSRSVARTRTTHSNDTYNSGSSNAGSNNYPVAQTQTQSQPVYTPVETPAPVQQPTKKGWSAKAKGAVIGAGVGAIGGAIINKQNRGKGAIIGGIIGAAGGLGTGAILDKRNGR